MARNFWPSPEISGDNCKTLLSYFLTQLSPRLSFESWACHLSMCHCCACTSSPWLKNTVLGDLSPEALHYYPRGNILTSVSSLNQCYIKWALDTHSNFDKRLWETPDHSLSKDQSSVLNVTIQDAFYSLALKITLPHLGWLVHAFQIKGTKQCTNSVMQTTWSCLNSSINIYLKYKITILGRAFMNCLGNIFPRIVYIFCHDNLFPPGPGFSQTIFIVSVFFSPREIIMTMKHLFYIMLHVKALPCYSAKPPISLLK